MPIIDFSLSLGSNKGFFFRSTNVFVPSERSFYSDVCVLLPDLGISFGHKLERVRWNDTSLGF